MLTKLKGYAIAALGFVVAVLAAMFYREKAARATEQKEASEKARATESKATDAIIEGAQRENEIRETPIDTRNRTHFE